MPRKLSKSTKVRRELLSKGNCGQCGSKLDRKGSNCKACLEKHNKLTRTLKQTRREAGLCLDCGEPRCETAQRCAKCQEKFRVTRRGYEDRKIKRILQSVGVLNVVTEAKIATSANRKPALRKLVR